MRAFLILVAFLASASAAQANLKSCQALYLATPASLGGYAMVDRKDYEKSERGAGYTVQFRKSRTEVASVFFYDRGQSRFSEHVLATELSASTAGIYRLRVEGRNVTDGDVFFDRPKKPVKGLFGIGFVHLEFDGRTRQHDYITLGAVDGCLVKLIFSAQGSKNGARRKFNRVLNDLLDHLARS